MDKQTDLRIRAFTSLGALRESLPLVDPQGGTRGQVTTHSIDQFERALDDLEATSENLSQYRIGKRRDGKEITSMPSSELFGRVQAVLGYFTVRDAVLNQANATGAALQSLIGFQMPQR